MMSYSNILIFMLIIIVFSTGCDRNLENKTKKEDVENRTKKNDVEKKNLYGNVKSLKSTQYDVVEKFGEISKGRISSEFIDNSYIIYNKQGNKEEGYFYKTNGDVMFYFNLNYDDKENIVESNEFNSDKSLRYKYIYKYDDKGNEIEGFRNDPNGEVLIKYTSKYDNKGNEIESNTYNSDGDLSSKYLYKYDDFGNQIESYSYNSEGFMDTKTISKYDVQHKKIEYIIYNPKGRFLLENEFELKDDETYLSKVTMEYDELGNIIKEESHLNFMDTRNTKDFEYEFDKNNNWIKCIEYKDRFPKYITERSIEYY